MANAVVFSDEEMAIDEGLGYPKAYAKLRRDRGFGPYIHGPPFAFVPYALTQEEDSRANELDELFPIVDPKAKPTTKPGIFLNLLWKQLNHLGNAGFDPEIIRVDPYGNVLYYHADAASPLAWDIDHCFPCSRGGLTVLSNLRILQWQVCKRKHNKLEFLRPWWDFQLGISINQFLSIFASSNSDFRRRAFSWLFSEGESKELNASQTVDSHTFPPHFLKSKDKVGLAAAAVVRLRRESFDVPLKTLDFNRRPRPCTSIIAAKKIKEFPNENQDPIMASNPYLAIVLARDSLKQREETVKMQTEIQKLDSEVGELQQKTEEEKLSIQELELVLTKKRRRAEKCRKLAESQSSYRAMLEKMIRDAMHQSIIYKEQVRLNQAATSALMARLEAQKAICDSAERDLHMKYIQRDELEKQIRPESDQGRKRSRLYNALTEKDDNTALYLPGNEPEMQPEIEIDHGNDKKKTILCLPEMRSTAPSHKELRRFLEEEQRASAASLQLNEERREQEEITQQREKLEELEIPDGDKIQNLLFPFHQELEEEEQRASAASLQLNEERWEQEEIKQHTEKLEELDIHVGDKIYNLRFPFQHELEVEDEEIRRQRGKVNIEKWLQFLLENTMEDVDLNPQECTCENETSNRTDDDLIKKLNQTYPHAQITISGAYESQQTETLKVIHKTDKLQPVAVDKNDEKTMKAVHKTDELQPVVALDKNDEKTERSIEIEARNSISCLEKENGKKNSVVDTANCKTPYKNPPYRIVPEKTGVKELASTGKVTQRMSSPDENARRSKAGKEKELLRSESARGFRRIPSSPSLFLGGMKKRVDCIGKKPLVLGDNDGDEDYSAQSSFLKLSIKTIKRAVRI